MRTSRTLLLGRSVSTVETQQLSKIKVHLLTNFIPGLSTTSDGQNSLLVENSHSTLVAFLPDLMFVFVSEAQHGLFQTDIISLRATRASNATKII